MASQPDTGTMQQETARYVYEPLPSNRWVRVMVLDPAQSPEEPLVARLELLDLGPRLPPLPPLTPPQLRRARHETRLDHQDRVSIHAKPSKEYETFVESKRLPYTALSYSWAMEDGDDSPSRVLILGNHRFMITQNLAEGLHRARSNPTNSEPQTLRLWVDAVCIDQYNLAEREAQVAMMADIYRLAERCMVWLGAGPTEEHDWVVWQLSHCLSRRLKLNYVSHSRPSDQVSIMVLEAFMDVVKSRCTPQTCHGGHPLLTDADYSAAVKFRSNKDVETAGRGVRDEWLSSAQQRFSMIEPWLQRRYWQRRWVLQEIASRNKPPAAIDYSWGQFSRSGRRIQNMLALLVHMGRTDLHPFNLGFYYPAITTIMRCGHSWDDDVCDLLEIYADAQCRDPRDRLYSLISLAPEYEIKADYGISMRDLCIEFSKEVVRRGYTWRLLLASSYTLKDSLSSPVPDLPSWALDLGGKCRFGSRVETSRPAIVNSKAQLSLEARFLGCLVEGNTGNKTLRLRSQPQDDLRRERPELTYSTHEDIEVGIFDGSHCQIMPWPLGTRDAVYAIPEGVEPSNVVLWLTPVDDDYDHDDCLLYKLVCAGYAHLYKPDDQRYAWNSLELFKGAGSTSIVTIV